MSTTIDVSAAQLPDLSTKRVVILGGTGAVGEGVVRAWLRGGAEVIIPTRTEGRANQFRTVLGELGQSEKLRFVVGDYTDFESAEAMANRITQDHGEVTDVVASIGGWWQGKPLWEVTEAEWDKFFVGLTTAHVANVRAWIPRLPHSAAYQLILGGSAVQPVPTASIINMEQAALLMMRQVLALEVGEQRRIVSQVLGPVDTRLRHQVDPSWVSSAEVGLVTVGVAVSKTASNVDFDLHTKEQMLAVLKELGIFPSIEEEGSEN